MYGYVKIFIGWIPRSSNWRLQSSKDINEYVKSSEKCHAFKIESMKLKGLLGSIPIHKDVFETLYFDFIRQIHMTYD